MQQVANKACLPLARPYSYTTMGINPFSDSACCRCIKSFITHCITPKRVTSWRETCLHHCDCGQHSSFQKNNVAAVESCWQHCVRIDRRESWISNLPLWRQTRYRSTNKTVCCLRVTSYRCRIRYYCGDQKKWICYESHFELCWTNLSRTLLNILIYSTENSMFQPTLS